MARGYTIRWAERDVWAHQLYQTTHSIGFTRKKTRIIFRFIKAFYRVHPTRRNPPPKTTKLTRFFFHGFALNNAFVFLPAGACADAWRWGSSGIQADGVCALRVCGSCQHGLRWFIIQRGHEHTRRGNWSRGGLVERARIRRHCGPLCSKLAAAVSGSRPDATAHLSKEESHIYKYRYIDIYICVRPTCLRILSTWSDATRPGRPYPMRIKHI